VRAGLDAARSFSPDKLCVMRANEINY